MILHEISTLKTFHNRNVIKELLIEEKIEFFAIAQLLQNQEQQLHKKILN